MRRYRKHTVVYPFVIVAVVGATRWVEDGTASDAGPPPTHATSPTPAPGPALMIECMRTTYASACDYAYLPE